VTTRSAEPYSIISSHLHAFVEQKGIPAITRDYDEHACLYHENRVYRGKQEIQGFFEQLLAALPTGSIQSFALRSMSVEGALGYITWTAGEHILLGSDTFIIHSGKIVSQTVAMHPRLATVA